MPLPSTTPLWSRVEMTKLYLPNNRVVATVPTSLSPGCMKVPCIVPQYTSFAVREICDTAVATYLNGLDADTRTRLTGRSDVVRRQEVHRLGYAIFEASPYCFEGDEFVKLTFYICHKHRIVTDGDEIDAAMTRAELGKIVKTKVLH